jgi:tRNA-splicing ligase RtcB
MKCAANYAFCNREVITHFARLAFHEVFGEHKMPLVYDVSHNIAKVEKHIIDGEEKKFIVHRKGVIRAFGPGRVEIPEKYRDIGQPVLVRGSMGTPSYVLLGTQKAMQQTFGSTCYVSGNVSSQLQAKRSFKYNNLVNQLEDKRIIGIPSNKNTLLDEAFGPYKDVEQVVEACHKSGISSKVARLVPLGVIKG